jgi:glycosyltransferase involved in cell wall biosynthesis
MRIGLDARLLLQRKRGMGVNLNSFLNEILAVDREDQFFLFVDTSYEHNLPPAEYAEPIGRLTAYPNVTLVDVNAPTEFLWEQVYLPRVARRHRLDVLHCPANRAPFVRGAQRMIATVHDTIEALSVGEYKAAQGAGLRERFYVWRVRRYVAFMYKRIFRRLDVIITDSEHSKGDIQRVCGVPASRIQVIHLAPNDLFKKLDVSKENYLLMLGSPVAHKNCDRVMRAYAALPADLKRQYELRIIGKWAVLEKLAADLAEPNIKFQDADFSPRFMPRLVETFARATALLFVSRYEGFGIPPIEAMMCGTAVIASTASSIPEVVGDAALMVDPTDVTQIADAMRRILTDTALREALERAGPAQARKFSWKKSAQRHLDTYRWFAGASSGGWC